MTIRYYIRLHKRLDLNDTTMYFSCSKKLSEFINLSHVYGSGFNTGDVFQRKYLYIYLP